ncbi:Lrp/AsnC family transcriptional regulator [Polaromonas sp. JS666]|uniref:Lrp/AsnC family transcriptional regulator n=1 Tax=Polaromonas sp. (strain JS666 / ATCC BAA-500) TaxID=296591 RepID=UPI0000537FCB|nr:Lrp/AsnC family transcriptional regulator [Polaromonas sp. JS666]ABE46221.1 transcriptional regulator, AsnC family [Polaromonas sp. JS666]
MDSRLDDLDRHLLSLLQANAREPAANLARKLKVARTTVVARIARLERTGIVSGYGVRLGRQLEQAAVRAFCGLSVNAKGASAVMKALERRPEVEEVWAVSGQIDYMVLLRCDTPEKLDMILDQLGQIDGVNHTQTSMVLSRKIDRRSTASNSDQPFLPKNGLNF